MRRVDLLVDHTDVQRTVDPAGDALMLGGQLVVQRFAFVLRSGGQLLLVQDADGRLSAHHRDLGVRPGEHLGRVQRPGVHRNVCPAVGLSGDQRDPRNGALAERVQQLGATAHHATHSWSTPGR